MDFYELLNEFRDFNAKLLQMQNAPSSIPVEERIKKLQDDNDFSGRVFERIDRNGNPVKYIGFKPDIEITAKWSCENKLEWSVEFAAPMKTDGDGALYDVEYEDRFFGNGYWFGDYDSLWKAITAIEEYTRMIRNNGGFLGVDASEIKEGWYLCGSPVQKTVSQDSKIDE